MRQICLALMIIFLLQTGAAFATPPFDLIPSDKWAHMFGNAWGAKYLQTRQNTSGTIILDMSLLSLAKECYDYFICKSEFSWEDLGFDLIGIGIGVAIN